MRADRQINNYQIFAAGGIPVVDAGDYFSGTNIEDVLQELGASGYASVGTINTIKEDNVQVGGSDIATLDFLGADFNLSESPDKEINISIEDSGIDHNATTNYDANEHIDHTGVTLTAGTGLTGGGTIAANRTFNVDVGIADGKIVKIDSATVANNDYAKFTANGLEGRSYSEVKTDLSLGNVENTAISTWTGSGNITTVGTVTSGTLSTGAVLADVTMTLGSDADGDIYYRASNKLTRLAKGTAGKVLTMNAGATAPEWSSAGAGDVTAVANMTDHTILRGDGGAKGIQDSGITIDDSDNISSVGTLGCGEITVADGSSINLQEAITFTGATTENLIEFPDALAVALAFKEGANSYLTFVSSDGSEKIELGKKLDMGDNEIEDVKSLAFNDGGATVDIVRDENDMASDDANALATQQSIKKYVDDNAGGGGDISKVGTPVDNEIGVWTGDGTIEGDTNFQWDSSALRMTGTIFIKEQADAAADVAGYGQLWVNTATPNELYFTNDTGNDREIVYSGGAFHDGFSDFVANEHINHTSVCQQNL